MTHWDSLGDKEHRKKRQEKTSAIQEEGQFLRLAEADPLRKTGQALPKGAFAMK
jgi:hypothetical protein